MKVRNIKVVKGSCPVVKSIKGKKSLVLLPSFCGLQNFDNFFHFKDNT
jgi:hypothetical protein